MISTVFTASDTADTLTFAEMAAHDGVYGKGSDTPEFFSIFGSVYRRDASSGDFIGPASDDGTSKYRRIPGKLEVVLTG